MFDQLSPEDSALWLATTAPALWPALLTSHGRAVPDSFDAQWAFARVHKDDPTDAGLTARLLLSHWRWHRTTGELVRALEASELLEDDVLDRMATELLDGSTWPVPLTPTQLARLGATATTEAGTVISPASLDKDEEIVLDRLPRPPLRRWAAERAVRRGLVPLSGLLAITRGPLPARDRALVFAGLLDAADELDAVSANALIEVGIDWPHKTVRDRAARLRAAREAPPESPTSAPAPGAPASDQPLTTQRRSPAVRPATEPDTLW